MDIQRLPSALRNRLGQPLGAPFAPQYASFYGLNYFRALAICARSEIYAQAKAIDSARSQFFRFASVPIYLDGNGTPYDNVPYYPKPQDDWSRIEDFELGGSEPQFRNGWTSAWKVLPGYGSTDFDARYVVGIRCYWYRDGQTGESYRFKVTQQQFEHGKVSQILCYIFGEANPSAEVTLASVRDTTTPEQLPDSIKGLIGWLPKDIRLELGKYWMPLGDGETFSPREGVVESVPFANLSQRAEIQIGMRLIDPKRGYQFFRVVKQPLNEDLRSPNPNQWRSIPALDIGGSIPPYRGPYPPDGRSYEWNRSGPVGSDRKADYVRLALQGWNYTPQGKHHAWYQRATHIFENGRLTRILARTNTEGGFDDDAEILLASIVTDSRC